MNISLIVAASRNHVIGLNGDLPWHLSEDLKRFKAITLGKPVIMGRATYDSIGQALPGRQNIVMSQQSGFVADDCVVVSSVDQAIERVNRAAESMVIGGGKIYELFLPLANKIYFTKVDADIEGDTFFPALDEDEWSIVESESFPARQNQEFKFRIDTMVRI